MHRLIEHFSNPNVSETLKERSHSQLCVGKWIVRNEIIVITSKTRRQTLERAEVQREQLLKAHVMFLTVLHITFILVPDKKKKKMFSLACDIDSYFLYSPSTHLQLHAVHSIKVFFLQLCEVFGSSFKYFGKFWVFLVSVYLCVRHVVSTDL